MNVALVLVGWCVFSVPASLATGWWLRRMNDAERESVGTSSNLPDRAEAQRILERGNAPWSHLVTKEQA